jgi:hypothetical protein
MKLETQDEEEPLVEPDRNGEPSGGEGQAEAKLADGKDTARSAENIARWRCYLPEDCIETMIRMGWDRTT